MNKPTEEECKPKSVLALITKLGLNREQVQHQERAFTILRAHKIPYETLDGASPVNRDARNELFRLSGKRGVYPQFFLVHGEDKIEFIGDWEKFEALNDASSLPDEILDRHPEIMTWERILG